MSCHYISREPEKMPRWAAIALLVMGLTFAGLFAWEFTGREPLRDKLKREHVEFVREFSRSDEGQAVMARYARYNKLIGTVRQYPAGKLTVEEVEFVLEQPPKAQLWSPDAQKFYTEKRVRLLGEIYSRTEWGEFPLDNR